MVSEFTLDEETYQRHAAAIRRNDKGRALDYFTGIIFFIGLLVGCAGYYVFGPNPISHGTLACFVYWFVLRRFVLKALRARTFKRLDAAGKKHIFRFSVDGFVKEVEGAESESYSWQQIARVKSTETGLQLDYDHSSVWLPVETFENEEEFRKAAELTVNKTSEVKKR